MRHWIRPGQTTKDSNIGEMEVEEFEGLPWCNGLFQEGLDRCYRQLERAVFVGGIQLAIGFELTEHQLRERKSKFGLLGTTHEAEPLDRPHLTQQVPNHDVGKEERYACSRAKSCPTK
jgi:hypothetical protein